MLYSTQLALPAQDVEPFHWHCESGHVFECGADSCCFCFICGCRRDEVCAREVLPSSTLLLRMSISCKIAGGSIDDLKTKRRIKGLGFLFY